MFYASVLVYRRLDLCLEMSGSWFIEGWTLAYR